MAVWQISAVDLIQDPVPDLPLSVKTDPTGVLHIAYYDPDVQLVKHAWGNANSWTTEIVGPSAGTRSVSLAFDPAGYPCISYGDGVHFGNLMFAKRTAAGWTTSKVTSGAWGMLGNAGYYSSLAFDHAGTPHIAYIDGSSYASLYYASQNPDTSWKTTKVYSGESWSTATGFETALAFNGIDKAFIAFIDKDEQPSLMYTFSDGGETWKTSYLDPGTAEVVRTQSGINLAIDSRGYPHFSYCRKNSDGVTEVRYIAWGDNYLGWIRESVAMLSPSTAEFQAITSIAIDSHNSPHISYISTNQTLMYATRTAPDTWSRQTIDPSTRAYSHAIALGKNGRPAIAFLNATDARLMVAQAI